MKQEQFVYWLQGFVEMNPNAMPTQTQWQIIKDHLALVFKKETPYRIGLPDNPLPSVPFPGTIQPVYQPYKFTPFNPFKDGIPTVTC